jgi:hypothetical protein
VTGSGGNVREDPPYAARRFRHRETSEEAVLSVRLMYPTSLTFHAVIAARPDRSNIPGIQGDHGPGTASTRARCGRSANWSGRRGGASGSRRRST